MLLVKTEALVQKLIQSDNNCYSSNLTSYLEQVLHPMLLSVSFLFECILVRCCVIIIVCHPFFEIGSSGLDGVHNKFNLAVGEGGMKGEPDPSGLGRQVSRMNSIPYFM